MSAASKAQTATPKMVVLEFLRLMSTGAPADSEKAGQLYEENATLWVLGSLPTSGMIEGRDRILNERVRTIGPLIVPGSKSSVIGAVVCEGEYVAAEWKSRRTLLTGQAYENDFFGLFQVRDGKIVSLREYLDTLKVKEAGWRDAAPSQAAWQE
jgi:hypothetical protein